MIKKIFSHSLLYAIGPQIPRVVSIFILPFTTKYLTPQDYGTSALITAYTAALTGIKDLGILVLLVNFFFQRTQTWKILWRKLYGYIVLWSPIFVLIQGLVIYLALPLSQLHHFVFVFLCYSIPVLLFDIPILFGSRYLQLSQKPLPIAVISAFSGLITLFANLITIVYFKMGYLGWILSTFIGLSFSFLCYAYFSIYKLRLFPIIRIQKQNLKNLLKVSLPTVPHNYSSYLLNTSDRAILSIYKTPIESIGIYNLAYSFGNYFEIFGNAVGMAVGPFYSKIYSSDYPDKNERIRTLTFFLQASFIFICALVALWIKEIFQLLISNNELKLAYSFSAIIILAYAYRPFYWSNINLLIFYKQTSALWKITFIGGLINVLLNLILIPLIGIWATTINTFISFLFIGFYGGFLKKTKDLGRTNFKEIYWIIILVLVTSVIYLNKDAGFVLKTGISLFLVIAYLFYIKKLLPFLKTLNNT